jgi:hypothetical protein
MEFKTKDLLVTVFPSGAKEDLLCKLRTMICIHPTRFGCERLCSFLPTIHLTPRCCEQFCSRLPTCLCTLHCSHYGTGGCGPWGVAATIQCPPGTFCDVSCPGSWDPPYLIQNLEDLATLKAELQATLKSLDALQKEGLPTSIGSKSEAEALERGLTEALEQVRAAKKKL